MNPHPQTTHQPHAAHGQPGSHPHNNPHSGRPAEVPGNPGALSTRLKTETHEQHIAAERHPFHGMLFRGKLPLASLLAQHAEIGAIQTALEKRLSHATAAEARAIVRPYHFRGSVYAADLAKAGGSPTTSSAAGAAFVEFVNHADELSLLGVLYVLEGSTNGGPFIQGAIDKHHPGVKLTALAPHGDQQAPRWSEFRAGVDALKLTPDQATTVVAGAAKTFSAICGVMDDVMAATAPAALPR